MDARPQFWLLNSTRKMMACSRNNQKGFQVPHPVYKYTQITNCKIRIANVKKVSYLHGLYFLRYLEYLSFEVPRCRLFRQDTHKNRRKTRYMLQAKKFLFALLSWLNFAQVLSTGYLSFLVDHGYAWKDSGTLALRAAVIIFSWSSLTL